MVTYNFNVGGIDRLAIAEEVMNSAGNILVAAGFAPEEIEALFRQAADQMSSGEAVHDGGFMPDNEASNSNGSADAEDILSEFNQLPSIRALEKLKTRAEALDRPHDSVEALSKCYDIAMKMMPHIEEASKWLKATANAAGVRVKEWKSDWIETASDEELDRVHEIIFLDDFDVTYPLGLDFINQVFGALIDEGDESSFDALYARFIDSEVGMDSDMLDTLKKGILALSLHQTFEDFILSQRDEVMETSILQDFVRIHSFPEPSYLLTGWLRKLEEAGRIARYKSGNRLRLRVL